MSSSPSSAGRRLGTYPDGRADPTARRLARMWARIFGLGLAPRRWVTLEVPGRKSGQPTRFPLGMATLGGGRYLVSMLGEQCNWVQNVRAAHGVVTLRHGRAARCLLAEVPVSERPPILRKYLRQVPGARLHVPVSHRADIGSFALVASRYPVFLVTRTDPRPSSVRTRRWWRWLLASVAAVIVVVVLGAAAFIKLSPSAAPLVLPKGQVSRPAGPLGGTWDVGAGSVAGFRVQESALGFSNYVGGQTPSVSGTIVITGTTVTAASFHINLTTIEVNGKKQAQFAASLGTRDHPVASFTLRAPVPLGQRFAAGRTVTATATGELTMNGLSRLVTVTLAARRAGRQLQTAGSIPVTFSRWDITQPAGAGFLGGLASHGTAEFLLRLNRPGS